MISMEEPEESEEFEDWSEEDVAEFLRENEEDE